MCDPSSGMRGRWQRGAGCRGPEVYRRRRTVASRRCDLRFQGANLSHER